MAYGDRADQGCVKQPSVYSRAAAVNGLVASIMETLNNSGSKAALPSESVGPMEEGINAIDALLMETQESLALVQKRLLELRNKLL